MGWTVLQIVGLTAATVGAALISLPAGLVALGCVAVYVGSAAES